MTGLLRCLIPWLAFAVATSLLHGAEERAGSGEVIDHVWAGHPVGFALLVEHDHVFAAYYDAERRLTVAARGFGEADWKRVTLNGVWNSAKLRPSNVVGWDSHNSIVLMPDRDGYLHLSANMHVDPLVYYRTTRPYDVTSFERIDRMTGERETRCTYPHFFKDASGELFFCYRDGSSGDAVDLYNRYDTTTRTWRRHIPTPLFDGEGARSAYASFPRLGPDGRFHVLWMWRDTPDAATNQQLSYARSADLLTWEDAHGRPVALPITFGGGERIDDARPGEGLVNTTYALGFDAKGVPLAVYHRYDAAGHSQLFAARPAGEGWERRALTNWNFRWAFGGGGSLRTDVYVLPLRLKKDGTVLVPFTAKAVPSGTLQVDPETLSVIAELPAEPGPLPASELQPQSTTPGMEVRTRSETSGGTRYILRWETLPSNRDNPRETIPPACELRLIQQRETSEGARPISS